MRFAFKAVVLLLFVAPSVHAEDEFDKPPIGYSHATPDNRVSRLQEQLDGQKLTLEFDDAFGYLPALLHQLQVPRESQLLVFSKTSMQRARIAPKTPRAIYFSDDVYVGYCRSGDVIEVSTADPALGAVFYTLAQKPSATPQLMRQTHQCLQCHSTSHSGEAPSHLVRSVFTDAAGLPILSEGSFRVDHTTPLAERWGGWYVTGTHGSQPHLGNLVIQETPLKRPIQNAAGLNVTDLSPRLPANHYLTPHSDIVALMVFEHQTLVHNLITLANFTTQQALHYETQLNRELGEPASNRLESTSRRIASAGDALVEGLLFVGEAPLTAPIAGTSDFARQFASAGPSDPQGRSLREFDLTKRMFKYPCSYLIYAPAFERLPAEMKAYVSARLRHILTGANAKPLADQRRSDEKSFAHLSAADRQAIWEILLATKPDLFAR